MSVPVFSCPMDCLPGVGQVFGGQYPIDAVYFDLPAYPVILDIGANVGAFSLQCLHRWPKATIHAYEPHPEVFPFLVRNLRSHVRINCHQAAVGMPNRTFLYEGKNRLTSSLLRDGSRLQVSHPVLTIAPELLPKADLMKIDVEGTEVEIVRMLSGFPDALIVEWHDLKAERAIDKILRGGMWLRSAKTLGPTWGVNLYTRR